MPPKKRPPAPIDRPLSKAYLREFTGWSTAYPPGLSEPNSLRVMENVMVTREGAARVRPGLRSYMRTKSPYPLVGSHELFYFPDSKGYLVAVRETVDVGTANEREIVGFRVIGPDASGEIVMDTLSAFGFDVPSDPNVLSFTAATTYVKYLQIDNKIFALPNTPEGMLMFWVGEEKKAKKLQSIVRPTWSVADKLSVMQPASGWVLGNHPSATRTNLMTNPDLETGVSGWSVGNTRTVRSEAPTASVGSRGLAATSAPDRINWCQSPLHNVASTGAAGWLGSSGVSFSIVSNHLRITTPSGKYGYARSNAWPVTPGGSYSFAFSATSYTNVKKILGWMEFYNSAGTRLSTVQVLSGTNLTTGIKASQQFSVPVQATTARVLIGAEPASTSASASMSIRNVNLAQYPSGPGVAVDGDAGPGYSWEGTPNASRSVYHPPQNIVVYSTPEPVTPGVHTVSADVRGTSGNTVQLIARSHDANGTVTHTQVSSMAATGAFSRMSVAITVPSGSNRLSVGIGMPAAGRASRLYGDAFLIERAPVVGSYFSGATPNSGSLKRRWLGTAHASASIEEDFTPSLPSPLVPVDDALVSSNQTKNRYSFSFFYTISNELGESAASQVTTIKTQRPWTAWRWLDPNGVDTDDPNRCADQLVVTMPQSVFDAAVDAGATHWTAYYFSQGPNDAPSVTAVRFAEIDLTSEPNRAQHGYARLTPQQVKIGIGDPLVPTESTRFNASDPVKGSQGLVAAERLILVGNPADPARISWSSGAPGDYHNFSSLLGGGSKQLTSGNLYITACVKLWQNPQSVDTLTVLNSGDDGRSNAYYMQPAQITSLSESISVMGFEEVTAMNGTVSPYGCEVVSNGLYRPQFHGLFKSTANNYNLSTKPVSDSIQNVWRTLQTPHRIVSAQLDSRIYFLVHNILGAALEPGCNGNEVWVIDLAASTPHWSRWSVQGVSLRAMDVDSVVMMSIVRPDGIFTFHEDRYTDERFDPDTGLLETANIKWYLETNTQGANRAHDAWCSLQQANAHVGNFLGQMRYGIRGQDVNGKPVEIEKVLLSSNPPPLDVPDDDLVDGFVMPTLAPTEREDFLLIRKLMKEWVFFAGSVNDTVPSDEVELEVPRFGGGQVNSVQYRYTPATVNVGYEYGSVETFEYGSSAAPDATTDSGTPKPYVDLTRA